MPKSKMTLRTMLLVALSAVLAAGCGGDDGRAQAGEKIYLGRAVPAPQRAPMDRIDHSSWDALLKKYVDDNGNVAYAAWKQSPADIQALDAYLNRLSAADRQAKTTKHARLAFWMNAYNAVTVRGILREYPTTSIRNHTAKLYGYNIWHDLLLRVGGEAVSLDTIEHKILRPLGDPRIHFGLVCAAKSCPRLLNEAFTAEKVDRQLNFLGRDFFSRPKGLKYDPQRKTIELSAILSWFGSDFGGTQDQQLRAIAPYFPSEEAQRLATSGAARVSYLDYDWSLNSQRPVR